MFDTPTKPAPVSFCLVAGLACLALAGCENKDGGTAPTSSKSVAEKTEEPEKQAEPAPTTYLVWFSKSGERAKTTWLESGDSGFEAKAQKPGVAMAVDGRLWRWKTEVVRDTLFSCGCVPDGAEPSVDELQASCQRRQKIAIRSQSLRELGGDRVLAEAVDAIDQKVGNYVSEVRLRGSYGPYLLVSTCIERERCHDDEAKKGGARCSFDVWDLREGRQRTLDALLSDETRKKLREHVRPEAIKFLTRRLGGEAVDEALDGLELTMAWPEWGGEGLEFGYQYSVPVDAARSDAFWSSGTASVRVTSAKVVPEIDGVDRRAPEPVAEVVKRSGARLYGFSKLPEDREAWRRLKSAFEAVSAR